jgi:hypothetical protein
VSAEGGLDYLLPKVHTCGLGRILRRLKLEAYLDVLDERPTIESEGGAQGPPAAQKKT